MGPKERVFTNADMDKRVFQLVSDARDLGITLFVHCALDDVNGEQVCVTSCTSLDEDLPFIHKLLKMVGAQTCVS